MDDIVVGSPRKRKVAQPENYKANKVKEARLKGQEYVNHSGQVTSAKQPKFECR